MINENDYDVYYEDGIAEARIKFKAGKFIGCVFSYGAVSFGEDDTMNFEYDVHSGTPEPKEEFEKVIGDLLVDMITNLLKQGGVVFKGGT